MQTAAADVINPHPRLAKLSPGVTAVDDDADDSALSSVSLRVMEALGAGESISFVIGIDSTMAGGIDKGLLLLRGD